MKRHEYITLALIVIFGLAGTLLFENSSEWLANFCVIPPSIYYVVASRSLRGEAIS